MSRKREKQRDSRRELARQLDVDPEDASVDDLVAKQRVTDTSLVPSLDLVRVKRGLLARPKPVTLQIALYIVDAAGARLATVSTYRGAPTKKGAVPLERVSQRGDAKVRYARP